MASTIKDIAKRLNISVSTVSYALNGGPRTVPDVVRDRVMEAARDLDYRPNRLARSLATGRSHTIGVVPTAPIHDLTGMNYFRAVFNGVVNAAEETHQDVMLFTRADASRAEALDTLLDGRVDGVLVFSPVFPSPIVPKLRCAGLPFATVSTAASDDYPSFGCDNAVGIRLAVDHLVALGHTRIGHIAGLEEMHDGVERLATFRRAMLDHGLEVREEWIRPGGFTIDGGRAAAAELHALPERPTALVCANDESAHGACLHAASVGLRVPEDLSVVGFDDAEFARYLTPSLTTIAQPLDDMGAAALHAVVNLIEGRPATPQTFPPHLIERSSAAPVPTKEGQHQ